MLRGRELDLFGDRMNNADAARMSPFNEREHQLSRSLSCLETVETQSVFKNDSMLLIRGQPGSGKSTFCHFILREWLAGRLWKGQFDFVFYVNAPLILSLLGDMQPSAEAALKVACPGVFRSITYDELNECCYLVIIDSIDECDVDKICAGSRCTASEEAIRQLIISREDFKRIVLGRPHACDQVRQTLLKDVSFQFVEVVGFSSSQLKMYVQKFFEPDASRACEVWKKVGQSSSMYNLSHLPVFANIICNILSEDSILVIGTMTEIYVYAYVVFLTRHLKACFAESTSTFEGLFNDEKLMDALLKLSEMAFQNLTRGKIFFESRNFCFSDIEFALVSPFFVRRQQFLCFSHLTLMEFLAAVHLFINRGRVDDEFFCNENLRGVLPLYFGLLGGAVENSDSPKIILSFVKPLMERFHINSVAKHPLCGEIGEVVYRMDKTHQLYLNLMFEFMNARLLVDSDLFWENDAWVVVFHHYEVERLLFFLRNFIRLEGRGLDRLAVIPTDGEISLCELVKLRECMATIAGKTGRLDLCMFAVNEEKVELLASCCSLVQKVSLYRIQITSVECWKILLRQLQDAERSNCLELVWLAMVDCHVDRPIEDELRKIVREVYMY